MHYFMSLSNESVDLHRLLAQCNLEGYDCYHRDDYDDKSHDEKAFNTLFLFDVNPS